VAQIQAGASEDLPLQLKADKDAGAHFLMIEMALAWKSSSSSLFDIQATLC
jgi:hypothetical protein